MPLPRIRTTVRRLMLIVAVVALALWMFRLYHLRQRYLEKAANHAGFQTYVLMSPDSIRHWEDRWTAQREGRPAKFPWPAGPPIVPAVTNYHDEMRLKWERAARMPWLAVEPDPL